jgi:iron transport multicopper oxidase
MQNMIDTKVILYDTSIQSNDQPSTRASNIPIAVIGMSGRFPDANSVDELWSILAEGVDCHRVVIFHPQ